MELNRQIEISEANLQRKLEWIGRHDTRVAFSAGIILTMLGVLASAGASVNEWNWCYYFIFGLVATLLIIGLIALYFSQYPKTTSRNFSLIYFGTIAELKYDEFKKRTKERSEEEYLDDLLCQIHINSRILRKKYLNLKTALILLGIAIIPWIIAIYLSKIYFN